MPNNLHDGLFKATFSQVDHAAGELRVILPPALAARLDFSTLTLCPGSFVDEAFSWRHTDLLFTALFAGRPALVYLLFEHQSSEHPRMPFRMLQYEVRIWEAHLAKHPDTAKLPVILPVVPHHGDGGWRAAVAFEELLDIEPELLAEIGAYLPRFQFVLDDLDTTSDDAIRARAMSALGRFVLWCLKHARRPGLFEHELGRWGEVVREAWNAPDGGAAIRMIFRYIFEVDEQLTVDELKRLATKTIGEDVEEEIVTLADRLREEGRQKGERTGERKLLLKQLTLRFGTLPDAALARVNAAGVEQLEAWAERVLTALTLAEVIEAS